MAVKGVIECTVVRHETIDKDREGKALRFPMHRLRVVQDDEDISIDVPDDLVTMASGLKIGEPVHLRVKVGFRKDGDKVYEQVKLLRPNK